jgi:hypothetical protein
MSHGPSENAFSVQKEKAGLVPLLSSVEDVDTTGVHPLPFPFPVGAKLSLLLRPCEHPPRDRFAFSQRAHGCACPHCYQEAMNPR